MVSGCWRWGGHAACQARRDPTRMSAALLSCRETIRGMMWRSSDPDRRRLGRQTQQGAPVSRWEDQVQDLCNRHTHVWNPWQDDAQDKEMRASTFQLCDTRLCLMDGG